MKTRETFAAGGTVAQVFDRNAAAQAAANRLRAAGFSDVRLSESSGTTSEAHVSPAAGTTEIDFSTRLEQAGFEPDRARDITRAVASGAVLLTVVAGSRAADAAAVLAGEAVAVQPLGPVDVVPAGTLRPTDVPNAGSASAETAPQTAREASTFGVVPLRAERLEVSKERKTTEARVRKEIVTEQKTIVVPVEREQLVIERDGEAAVRIPLSDP